MPMVALPLVEFTEELWPLLFIALNGDAGDAGDAGDGCWAPAAEWSGVCGCEGGVWMYRVWAQWRGGGNTGDS